MSSAHVQTPPPWFANDSSRTVANPRTLAALVAIRNQEVADRIKQLRESRGNPPQPVVAAEIGVSLRAYQKYEAGDAIPRYHNLGRLAEYYGVTESYILEGVDSRPEVQGIPEQLSDVDQRFSTRVDDIEAQLDTIQNELAAHDRWARDLEHRLMDERAVALARANERLVNIETKLDRLLHMVDEGLFTPRAGDGSREEQVGLGEALGAIVQANPDALEVLARQHRKAQEPPQRTGARRSRRAG